jgi:hypothetical protein
VVSDVGNFFKALALQKTDVDSTRGGKSWSIMKLTASSVLLAFPFAGTALASTVHLAALSDIPKNASETLDRRLASFSIEFSFLPDFGGNKTHPNLLTKVVIMAILVTMNLMVLSGTHATPS